MLELTLAGELRSFLADVLANVGTEDKNGDIVTPRIVDAYLPPKQSSEADDFPFVIVRPEDGSLERDYVDVTVGIIIGCYSKEYDGYGFCLIVMERIRAALAMLPAQTLARRFQLLFPIEWENLPEQPYPLWQLTMTTKWRMRAPEIENTMGGFGV